MSIVFTALGVAGGLAIHQYIVVPLINFIGDVVTVVKERSKTSR